LLERTSSDPCDKVFALFGILGANEIALSQSDYSRSLRDTYLIFFQDLLFSDPAFVTLLLSAGIRGRKQGWPSWLPNWSALERDAWLVSRYRLNLGGYWHKPHFLATQPPTVSGSNLTLRGSSIGTLEYIVRFGPLSDKDDHSQLVTTLRHLAEWIWSVTSETQERYRYRLRGDLFAILEGHCPVENGKSTRDPDLDPWDAPYDFKSCENSYRSFLTFLDAVSDESTDEDDILNYTAMLSTMKTKKWREGV